MKLYSRVKLCTNKYSSEGITIGAIGYIIESYDDGNYEVEFSNKETGETIAQVVVAEEEIEIAESR